MTNRFNYYTPESLADVIKRCGHELIDNADKIANRTINANPFCKGLNIWFRVDTDSLPELEISTTHNVLYQRKFRPDAEETEK